MKNILIIFTIVLSTICLPLSSAMPWGTSGFSTGSFSTISASSDGGTYSSGWSSPSSWGWEAGDGGSWSRLSDVQSATAIINSSDLVSVNTDSFANIYGSFSSTSVFRSETIDLGTFEGVGKVSEILTYQDITFSTPSFYSGTITTKEYQDTTTKETTTTAVSQVMTPTGSGIADTSTGWKAVVELGKDTEIPAETSSTVFQDKLDSLQNTDGEKFMVFGSQGDPIKAYALSDDLGNVDFAAQLESALTATERPVDLSLCPISGMSLETYTLTEGTDLQVSKELLSENTRTETTTAYDQIILGTTSTQTLLTGISFDVDKIEETKTIGTPVLPVSSSGSGDSSGSNDRYAVHVSNDNGITTGLYYLGTDEVQKVDDRGLEVSKLPDVGHVSIVDTKTNEVYSGIAGTPEANKEATDAFTAEVTASNALQNERLGLTASKSDFSAATAKDVHDSLTGEIPSRAIDGSTTVGTGTTTVNNNPSGLGVIPASSVKSSSGSDGGGTGAKELSSGSKAVSSATTSGAPSSSDTSAKSGSTWDSVKSTLSSIGKAIGL